MPYLHQDRGWRGPDGGSSPPSPSCTPVEKVNVPFTTLTSSHKDFCKHKHSIFLWEGRWVFLTGVWLLLIWAEFGITLNRMVPWELIWQELKIITNVYVTNKIIRKNLHYCSSLASGSLYQFIFPQHRWPTSIWMTCSGSRPPTGFPFTSTNISPGWRSPETHKC